MQLKLFRRHGKCSMGYAREDRIHEFDSKKRTGRAQCDCLISAEGKLRTMYLQAKSTGCRDWESARKIASQWEQAGTAEMTAAEIKKTQASADSGSGTQGYALITVPQAVDDFYMVQRNKGISDERIAQYRQLLTRRLLPYVKAGRIEYIQQMDKSRHWSLFRDSWRNLNPEHNKKSDQPLPDLKVGLRTASRMVSDLRIFINHCVSNEWLSDNWAHRKHGMVTTKFKDPKEPFSDEDVQYVYRAAEHVTDGRGFKSKRTGTMNGFEDLVFTFILRYTGLRISDVCMLNVSQLVTFEQFPWTHAISCFPMKTSTTRDKGNHVLIPIPSGNLQDHPNVVAALQALPLKHGEYFFLGGGPVPEPGTEQWKNRVRHATNGWRERINRLFLIAERLMKEEGKHLSVHPHPHRFRHTFCAWLLQKGLSLRTVAAYIGDTEDTVRAHYGKFCHAEQLEAARAFGEAVSRPNSAPTISFATSPWPQLPSRML